MTETTRAAMEPAQILHELAFLGIRFRVHKGAFVTADMLPETAIGAKLRAAIGEQSDALADLTRRWPHEHCAVCRTDIAHGARFVRVWSADEGTRETFHPACHAQRAEAKPYLPMPEILFDLPGIMVLIEDSGLCAFCRVGEAALPEQAPNVCNRCNKIRQAKEARAVTAA